MHTSMMRFHPLQSVDEEASALKVYLSCFGDYTSINLTSRPKRMSHGTPRILWIGAKIAFAVLTNVKTRCCPCYSQVDNASFICDGLDQVGSSVFTESNSTAIGIERELLIVEAIAI